jgi:hypothetical protein
LCEEGGVGYNLCNKEQKLTKNLEKIKGFEKKEQKVSKRQKFRVVASFAANLGPKKRLTTKVPRNLRDCYSENKILKCINWGREKNSQNKMENLTWPKIMRTADPETITELAASAVAVAVVLTTVVPAATLKRINFIFTQR